MSAALTATSMTALMASESVWAQSAPSSTPTLSSTPTPDSQQPSLNPQNFMPDPPTIAAKAWVLMDARTGNIIYENDENEHLPPASLTKLMTAYTTEYELSAGRLHLNDVATVSTNAWHTGGSRMFLKPNTQVPIGELLRGLIVVSGNDAAVTLAEHISGSEGAFAQLMNEHAQMMGLKDTHYMNPTGLPTPDHYTSAHDLAVLARHIIYDFPQYYSTYKEKYFTYNNIKQPNRVLLLWRDPRVDGLKTGFTDAAGYCMLTSGVQGDTRLIAVVLGADSEASRAQQSETLLNYGFRYYHTQQLFPANHVVSSPRVWGGANTHVNVGFEKPLLATLPVSQGDLTQQVQLPNSIEAPIKKGQQLGTLTVLRNGKEISSEPIVALSDDPEGGLFRRLSDSVIRTVTGWF